MRVPLAPARSVPVGAHAHRGVRKRVFAQGVIVLFDVLPTLPRLVAALGDFEGAREFREDKPGWKSGDGALLPWRRDVNGVVQVDLVDRPWPDHVKGDSELLAAWKSGHFGPTAFSGALERAMQHGDGERAELARRHRGFARVRLGHGLGLGSEASTQPEGTDPIDELRFVSAVQLAVSALPGALVLFNPNGELLISPAMLEGSLRADAESGRLPVDAWTNVRRFAPNRDWLLFDTPGMGQLDVVDHELVLPRTHPSIGAVHGLAFSMCAWDATKRGVLRAGSTSMDTTGPRWTARAPEDPVALPPRAVLRWYPDGIEPLEFA